VVQASNNEAATPVRPPQAEVPAVEEESLDSGPAAEGLPAPVGESEVEPTAAAESTEDKVLEDAVLKDVVLEDKAEEVVSRTAWRTFTNAPPRLAVQP